MARKDLSVIGVMVGLAGGFERDLIVRECAAFWCLGLGRWLGSRRMRSLVNVGGLHVADGINHTFGLLGEPIGMGRRDL